MRYSGFVSAFLSCLVVIPAFAEAPKIQTPVPVIFLADNLDEADQLGWCIDTLGRGFAENLQAHSCKPQGGDVQFSYNAETKQITSVEFAGKCMELIAPDDPKIAFGLRDCAASLPMQQFLFDQGTGRITPTSSPESCVAAGEASRQAGPFMSRDLVLSPCDDTSPELITWLELK
ncbi:ricin-type beta-trefoil lectin domain protein [Roseibium sp.]|uniref:ricin-type beta-trefoil lectin domain protein n=1 Tax=Roseibium sp. TaxID=1936156 RepID=UPI00260F8A03|nr:ricin-type beta-trefoil lectin domain protein [Roseibium sp.]